MRKSVDCDFSLPKQRLPITRDDKNWVVGGKTHEQQKSGSLGDITCSVYYIPLTRFFKFRRSQLDVHEPKRNSLEKNLYRTSTYIAFN